MSKEEKTKKDIQKVEDVKAETPVEETPVQEEEEEGGIDFNLSFKPGEIAPRSIIEEMKANYLDYSMSVIVSRALPEVRDGLKPSQRRVLVAMNDLGLAPNAHYRKCAKDRW